MKVKINTGSYRNQQFKEFLNKSSLAIKKGKYFPFLKSIYREGGGGE